MTTLVLLPNACYCCCCCWHVLVDCTVPIQISSPLACIIASRMSRLVALVSSSISNAVEPTSSASMMLAAWLVLPDASAVEKLAVGCLCDGG